MSSLDIVRSSLSPIANVRTGVLSGRTPASRSFFANAIAESPTTALSTTSGFVATICLTTSSTFVLPNGRYFSATSSSPSPIS